MKELDFLEALEMGFDAMANESGLIISVFHPKLKIKHILDFQTKYFVKLKECELLEDGKHISKNFSKEYSWNGFSKYR